MNASMLRFGITAALGCLVWAGGAEGLGNAAPPMRRMPATPVVAPIRPALPPYNPRTVLFPTSSYPVLPVNPNYQIAPGLTLNQYAYNVTTLGKAYSSVPPWAFGYNPYIQYTNYGPVTYPYPTTGSYCPYPNPYTNIYYNPYYNPGTMYINPYSNLPYGSLYGNPYSSISANPYP